MEGYETVRLRRILWAEWTVVTWIGAVCFALFACNGEADKTSDAEGQSVVAQDVFLTPAGDAVTPIDAAADVTEVFVFAVIADPHIISKGEHYNRTKAAIDWLNDNAKARSIELVWVLGDIGWHKGLPLARELLETLQIPYLPVLGDNEIQNGDQEAEFDQVYGPTFQALKGTLANFRRAAVPVSHPVTKQVYRLQNFSFDHRGVHFVGLDFNARVKHEFLGEQGSLYDFQGGTWPWLVDDIKSLQSRPRESVLLFSHIPLHASPGAFDVSEMATVTSLTAPRADLVYAHFAGHYHGDFDFHPHDAGYEVFVTDALWDDEIRVRLVSVLGNGQRFEYQQQLVTVPFGRP
jgi:hypothetical protein